jgi:hypothetical protein
MESPTLLAVLVAAVATGVAARSDAAPLSGATALAAAPWAWVAAGLAVGIRAGIYELASVPLPAGAVLAVGVTLLIGGWLVTSRLAALRDLPYRERYLSAAGLGACAVTGFALLSRLSLSPVRVGWIVLAVGVAVLFAALGCFGLGFVYVDALAELKFTGLYVLSAVVFEGSASAIAVAVVGCDDPGVLTRGIGALLEAGGLAVSEWLLLPVHTFVGAVVVALCGYLERRRRPLGYVLALLASVSALATGGTVLLSAVLRG